MKKLHLVLVGENQNAMDCLKVAKDLGHEIVACLSNNAEIKKYCEEEEISCFKGSAFAFIKQLKYDFCIVLSDVTVPLEETNWIQLQHSDAASTKTYAELFSSYQEPYSFWSIIEEEKAKRILQTTETDLAMSFYQLLVDLSRDNIQSSEIYSSKTISLDKYLSKLIDQCTHKSLEKKIALMSALYILLLKYFPYNKNLIKLGVLANDAEKKLNLAKEIQWIPLPNYENRSWLSFSNYLFKEIITLSMQEGVLPVLSKEKSHFDIMICKGENNESTRSSYQPELYFSFDISDPSLTLTAHYLSEKYTLRFIQDLLENFDTILGNLLETLETDINEIRLFNTEPPASVSVLTKNETVIHLFQKQVSLNPNSIAILGKNQSYSYQELDIASNKIAKALLENKIQKEDYVILSAKRSFEFIAAVLGIMKAGACYVPVHPHSPEQRIQIILKNTKAKIILTDANNTQFPQGLFLQELIKVENTSADFPILDENNLAYLIFTSGTTGLPKGVAIEHGGLAGRLTWLKDKFAIDKQDIILHHTNMSFDVSIEEIFLPLISGAKIVLAPDFIHEKLNDFVELIDYYKITYIEFVPSLLNLVLDYMKTSCNSLRYVISGSEPLGYDLLEKFYSRCSAKLINLYGPTETTINTTHYICHQGETRKTRYVPIGEAVAYTTLHVLDQNQDPVPLGGVGELCISGSGLARGYLNTACVIEPSTILYQNAPCYKTGDLVRYVNENHLEFLGRIDRQIKLRGYRIELEEIESVIASYDNVKQVALIQSEHEDHKKQLIAFISMNHNDLLKNTNTTHVLKEFCEKKLPHYMIPNAFILLPEIPLTSSGKTSYTQLHHFVENKKSDITSNLENGSNLEKTILKVFSSVLEEEISLDDNFFDFGGNSLTAIQIIANLAKENISVEVADIFQYPTIKSLAHYYNNQDKNSAHEMSIVVQPRNQRLPLSFSQQRLWYLYQLDGRDTGAYNIAMAFKLKGELNIPCLQEAINTLIERHEILRTVFKSEEGKPWQEIFSHVQFQLPIEKLVTPVLDNVLMEETHLPFNIENGPLFRFKLFQLTHNENVLCITMHNIITDGWSEGIIIAELNQLYNALIKKENVQLPSLLIQYVDFSQWQRLQSTPEKLKSKVKYWVEKLNDYSELELYHDAKTTVDPHLTAQDVRFSIHSVDLIQKIEALSKQALTTPYTILVTAFNLLLAYKTNQYDIVIGSGMAGRNHPDLDKLIGFFVNTVVLRNDLSGNPTFLNLIERVKNTCIEAHLYQDVPFEMIVDAMLLERETDKNPIFQILFILQKNDEDHANFNFNGLQSEPLTISRKTATFDITFNIDMTTTHLKGDVQYNAKLFSREAIEKMTHDFQRVLEVMVSMPEKPIQSLHLVSEKELTLINTWNSTQLDFADKKIHELFEESVRLTPNNIAISYQGTQLSYQQLNAQANQLAHYLLSQATQPQLLIGVCLERSIDYVITVLAILKAGSAFLPLDPEYPKERLQYYIEQSGVTTVICNIQQHERIQFPDSAKVLVLEHLRSEISTHETHNLDITRNELCYCIYTSGSTGNPKGILTKHTNVHNLLFAMQTELQFEKNEKLLSLTSISFDIFYLELFLPLVSGNTCILADHETVKDTDLLIQLIEKSQPTFIQATPSFWGLYLTNTGITLPNVKVLVGGEPLIPTLANKLLKNFKEVWNVYGPTETTIWSTIKKINESGLITIGKPLANTKCYVLNEHLQPVPLLISGELYIAGKGIAEGYINNIELTEQVFKKNPFEKNNQFSRIYKTGDFVRYLDNGELQYLRRKDQQVKVRGFRIELSEIETQILRYSNITEAVVMVNNADGKKDSLVTFYSTKANKIIQGLGIQTFISNKLPSYMVPNKWIQIDKIPKTSNGKIDRNKLKVMNVKQLNLAESHFIAPSTELDFKLVSIWQTTLEIDMSSISLDESFFMIGGHSLLIPQVVLKMNKELGSKITIRDFIQNPTICKLVSLITERLPSSSISPEVKMEIV